MTAGTGRTPDVYIVGAPKCGTTSIATYLQRYDGVFFPDPREVGMHGSDLEYLRGLRATGAPDEILADYKRRFAPARPDQLIGASPIWYLYSKRAAEELKQTAPDARIIISLREPVSFLKAFHAQMLYSSNETQTDFWAALEEEPARRAGGALPAGLTMRQSVFYRELPLFHDQVSRFLDVFGEDRVRVFLLDDIVRRPTEVEEAICAFLGLERDPSLSMVNANPRRVVRSAAVNRLLRRPPPLMRLAARLVPQQMRKQAMRRLKSANTRYVAKAGPAPDEERAREAALRAEYSDEIARLSALLRRDLSPWSRGEMI